MTTMMQLLKRPGFLVIPLALVLVPGCTRDYKFQPVDMWNNTRLKPYEPINFFADRTSAQTPPANTVARGQDRLNIPLYYGTDDTGSLVVTNPLRVDKALLERGQERYNINCQPCHGLSGAGDGLVTQRGMAKPPTYHQDRLRNATDGHYFDVITNGHGSMYSYSSRIPPRDRWAIVAYVRTLQRAQKTSAADLPAGVKPGKTALVVPKLNLENYKVPETAESIRAEAARVKAAAPKSGEQAAGH